MIRCSLAQIQIPKAELPCNTERCMRNSAEWAMNDLEKISSIGTEHLEEKRRGKRMVLPTRCFTISARLEVRLQSRLIFVYWSYKLDGGRNSLESDMYHCRHERRRQNYLRNIVDDCLEGVSKTRFGSILICTCWRTKATMRSETFHSFYLQGLLQIAMDRSPGIFSKLSVKAR